MARTILPTKGTPAGEEAVDLMGMEDLVGMVEAVMRDTGMVTTDATDAFADEVGRFEQWACFEIGQDAVAVREALVRVTRLYLAGLALPPPWSDGLSVDARVLVHDDEWRAVLQAAARLPVDHYGEVFDPLAVPPEQPVVGSVADDIADIYRDVVTGLRLDRSGQRPEAIWQWSFNLRCHWGEHATGAIRALHCWLAQEAPDHFTPARF